MNTNSNSIGSELHQFIAKLYPICRSITGNGVRETLRLIGDRIPLSIHEVPTGTEVYDWTIPEEWNIRDAWIKNSKGNKVVDFRKSNLHVVGYSTPVKKKISLEKLKEHIFTLQQHPDWIPYRHTYYNKSWGFCLSHKQFNELRDSEYEVCIDSSLDEGSLTYGECYLKGVKKEEILISCHICHPSLCNDNLSGLAIAVFLAMHFSSVSRKYSFRFLFHPTTIGSIAWLAKNEKSVKRIKHGLVLACLGDPGKINYKKSRQGTADIDKAVAHVLKNFAGEYKIMDFIPFGYDERQFCSPGFDLPVGCLMRTPHGQFAQYHSSADNLDFVQPEALSDSFEKCIKILDIIENNTFYVNLNPKGEPRLGKHGLYRPLGFQHEPAVGQMAILWTLNFSDGNHSLLDIANRAGMSFDTIKIAADALIKSGLIVEA